MKRGTPTDMSTSLNWVDSAHSSEYSVNNHNSYVNMSVRNIFACHQAQI